jgi:HTH-type transcriptional regulator/antitoxin HigA
MGVIRLPVFRQRSRQANVHSPDLAWRKTVRRCRHEGGDEKEREANDYASDVIIPASRIVCFRSLQPNREAILRFSVESDVAPGLTVGQMHHREMIGRDTMNRLKRRWRWKELKPLLD